MAFPCFFAFVIRSKTLIKSQGFVVIQKKSSGVDFKLAGLFKINSNPNLRRELQSFISKKRERPPSVRSISSPIKIIKFFLKNVTSQEQQFAAETAPNLWRIFVRLSAIYLQISRQTGVSKFRTPLAAGIGRIFVVFFFFSSAKREKSVAGKDASFSGAFPNLFLISYLS